VSVAGRPVGQVRVSDELAEARRALAQAPMAMHFTAAQRRLEEAQMRAGWLH
jgi:hypothetical protein